MIMLKLVTMSVPCVSVQVAVAALRCPGRCARQHILPSCGWGSEETLEERAAVDRQPLACCESGGRQRLMMPDSRGVSVGPGRETRTRDESRGPLWRTGAA